MLDEFVFFFFQVKHVHGPCVSTTRSCFLSNKQTIIKKLYANGEKKTKMAVDRERDIDRFLF